MTQEVCELDQLAGVVAEIRFALRRSANDFFLMGLNGILDIITSTVNRQEIPRLLRLNNIQVEKPPKLVHGDPNAPDLEDMIATFKELRDAGADVVFSDVIISALLERAGLPIPEELGLPMQASEHYDDERGKLRTKEKKRFLAGAEDGRLISRRQFFGGAEA